MCKFCVVLKLRSLKLLFVSTVIVMHICLFKSLLLWFYNICQPGPKHTQYAGL